MSRVGALNTQPEDRLGPGKRLARQRGPQADALHRLDLPAAELARINRPSQIHSGGDDVNQVRRLLFQRISSLRGNGRGPMCDERRAGAAFVREVLVVAEGRVGQRGPIHTQST